MSATVLEATPEPTVRPPRPRGRLVVGVLIVGLAMGALGYGWWMSGNGVALALTFTTGQSARYRMTMTVQGTMEAAGQSVPLDLTMSGSVRLNVLAVSADGVAEVQESFSEVQMTSRGEPVDVPAELPSPVLHITTDGRVISSTGATLFGGGGAQGPAQIGQDGLSAVLPREAVEPGDAWRTPVTQTILGTPVTYTADGTYLRDEPIAGADVAVVRTTALIPMDLTVPAADVAALMGLPAAQLPADASFTYAGAQHVRRTSWIDASASALLRTTSRGDYTMKMTGHDLPAGSLPPGGLSMRGTVTMTLERV